MNTVCSGIGRVTSDKPTHADTITAHAPEKEMDGQSCGLARQIPQRLLHARQGTGQDPAPPMAGVAEHALPVVDDSTRVFSEEIGLELFDRCSARSGTPTGKGLAQADQAFIRVQS